MAKEYNIYCDESCHLENDGIDLMVLGAVWCPKDKAREIAEKIREVKKNHGLPAYFEIKWNKVSPAKIEFYEDLVKYFFRERNLHFRALVADKTHLRHDEYKHDHNTWYYKMYFDMLKVILKPETGYYIYLDVKDTRGSDKLRKLGEVLCNEKYDFNRNIIKRMQHVRSSEVEQVQLVDLLCGAVGYINRDLKTSAAKTNLTELFQKKSGYKLNRTTLLKEDKTNIFIWQADWGREK